MGGTARRGGKRVVSRRAALPFAHDRQLLRMNLLRRCVPVRCQPDESCGEGGCEKVDKRPEDLPDGDTYNPAGTQLNSSFTGQSSAARSTSRT